MLRIVTDGAADLPQAWQKEYGVYIIPINIHIGDKTYLQGIDLDNEGFYKLVDKTGKVPKTSQPARISLVNFTENSPRRAISSCQSM